MRHDLRLKQAHLEVAAGEVMFPPDLYLTLQLPSCVIQWSMFVVLSLVVGSLLFLLSYTSPFWWYCIMIYYMIYYSLVLLFVFDPADGVGVTPGVALCHRGAPRRLAADPWATAFGAVVVGKDLKMLVVWPCNCGNSRCSDVMYCNVYFMLDPKSMRSPSLPVWTPAGLPLLWIFLSEWKLKHAPFTAEWWTRTTCIVLPIGSFVEIVQFWFQ